MTGRLLGLLALCWLVTSCRVHDVTVAPPPKLDVPKAFSHDQGQAPGPDRWWEGFGDSGLTATIDVALSGNLGLKQAWSRLQQVLALAHKQGAAGSPQIEAGLGTSHQRVYVDQPDMSAIDTSGGPGNVSIPTKTEGRNAANYSVNVGVSWEADLWGRVASLEDAALLDHLAGRDDLSAMAITIAAQVTELWFMLAEQMALEMLLAQQLATNRALLELVELRFAQGLAHAVDVRQQRQQISAMEADVPLVKGRLEVLRSQLAVVTGVPPQSKLALPSGTLPEPPAVPAAGVPLAVVTKRPDVRAAQRRVVAADHRVGAAIANRLPSLRLSGGVGFSDDSPDMLFMSWVYNLSANLVGPIFDGGRRAAEVDRTRAVVEERLHGFAQIVLQALKEVDDALALEARQVEHLAALGRSVDQARETLAEARNRYASGLTDYLPVLAAVKTLQTSERREVSARRQRLSYRVQLHRALGGTWADELKPPVKPPVEPPAKPESPPSKDEAEKS